jgi:hypothetical protein
MSPFRRDDGPLFEQRSTQEQEIARVRSRIGRAVQAFVLRRAKESNAYFYAEELRAAVDAVAPGAPGSPDRILRDLRQRGFLNYEVVNRAASLYLAKPRKVEVPF